MTVNSTPNSTTDNQENKSEEVVVMYSDGGAELNRVGAGACILENAKTGKRLHLLLFLGPCTNNEAEISAGLAGLCYFRALRAKGRPISFVRWIADSEYTLRGATEYIENWQQNGWRTANKQPVKNQGLWRCYLYVSSGLMMDVEHVFGHTGHSENEACDEAVNWAKKNGELEFDQNPEPHGVELNGQTWFLLDGRQFLTLLRTETHGGCSEEAYKMLLDQFGRGSLLGRSTTRS